MGLESMAIGLELDTLTLILAITIAAVSVAVWINNSINKLREAISALERRIARLEDVNEKVMRPIVVSIVAGSSELGDALFKSIMESYFTPSRKLSNPNPSREQRKKMLLEKARARTITQAEANEVRMLLERQKVQHQTGGDFVGAILAGLLLLFVVGVITSLFEDDNSE